MNGLVRVAALKCLLLWERWPDGVICVKASFLGADDLRLRQKNMKGKWKRRGLTLLKKKKAPSWERLRIRELVELGHCSSESA